MHQNTAEELRTLNDFDVIPLRTVRKLFLTSGCLRPVRQRRHSQRLSRRDTVNARSADLAVELFSASRLMHIIITIVHLYSPSNN